MITANEARAKVNLQLDFLVNEYLQKIFLEVENAQKPVVLVKSPQNQLVMLRVVKRLEDLGYKVTIDKYADPRGSWDNLLIRF